MPRTIDGWVAVNGNRRVSQCCASEAEALGAAKAHNDGSLGASPDTSAVAMHVEDYLDKLEAAVVTLEGLHAAQKAHMKQLWGDNQK